MAEEDSALDDMVAGMGDAVIAYDAVKHLRVLTTRALGGGFTTAAYVGTGQRFFAQDSQDVGTALELHTTLRDLSVGVITGQFPEGFTFEFTDVGLSFTYGKDGEGEVRSVPPKYTSEQNRLSWFGPESDAELTEDQRRNRVKGPDHTVICTMCGLDLRAGSPGVRMPSYVQGAHQDGFNWFHRACFRRKALFGA